MRRWQPGVVFALLCVAILPRAHTAPANTAAALSVQDAKGAQRLQSLGKAMLVEGYYVTDPVPMLVTDLQLMATNTILPADHYLVLSGPPPAGAQTGAKLRLSGVLRQPGGKDPAHLQSQTAVLQVATGASAQVLTPALSPSARVVRHVAPPSQPTFRLPDAASRFPAPDLPTKYAVIMNPGNSPDLGWRQRHLREAAAIRALLLSRDYRANAIFTLTGGGETTDRGQTRPATVANLRLLFDQLALMMRDNCQLVVYMTGLGGGFYDQQMGQEWESGSYGGVLDTNGDESHEWTMESVLHQDLNGDGDRNDRVAFDETLLLAGDQALTDDEFAANVNKIAHYGRMIFLLQQSFSGGFAHDLAGPNRLVLTACAEKQFAWGYSLSSQFSEFTHWLLLSTREVPVLFQSLAVCANYIVARDRLYPLEALGYEANGSPPPVYGHFPLDSPEVGIGLATRL